MGVLSSKQEFVNITCTIKFAVRICILSFVSASVWVWKVGIQASQNIEISTRRICQNPRQYLTYRSVVNKKRLVGEIVRLEVMAAEIWSDESGHDTLLTLTHFHYLGLLTGHIFPNTFSKIALYFLTKISSSLNRFLVHFHIREKSLQNGTPEMLDIFGTFFDKIMLNGYFSIRVSVLNSLHSR